MSLYVDIQKEFPGFLLNIQLDLQDGVTGLLGESGCGKSMTLQCISGIIKPDTGTIRINGQTVFDAGKKINLPIRQRNLGFSFQHCSLLPHMTVEQNIHFALKDHDKITRSRIVSEKIKLFGLEELRWRYPGQLSGGQKQRVTLARMLARSPQILMLDEPLTALDKHLRLSVENELTQTLGSFPHTTLYVSHDMDEAFRICPRLAVIDQGRVVDQGSRDQLLINPQTLASAKISGCKNLSPAVKTGQFSLYATDWGITIKSSQPVPDELKYVGIRARHIREAVEDEDQFNVYCMRVEFQSETRFENMLACRPLTDAEIPEANRFLWLYDKLRNQKTYKSGQIIDLHIPSESLHLLCR